MFEITKKNLINLVEDYGLFWSGEWLKKLINYVDIEDYDDININKLINILFESIEKMHFKYYKTAYEFLSDCYISEFKEAYENGACKNIYDLANFYLHQHLKYDIEALISLIKDIEGE